MNLKRDIPALICSVLLAAAGAGLVFAVQALTDQVLEQSMIRVFVEQRRPARSVAAQIEELDGVIKVETVEPEQAAAEFEAALGYPWPGSGPLPGYADVIIEPAQAAEVLDGCEAIPGIEYVAWHRDRMDQLAELVRILRRAQSLLMLTAILASAGLAVYAAGIRRRRNRLMRAASLAAAAIALIGFLVPQAAWAQTATELRQAYLEAQSALDELREDYDRLEREADSLLAAISSGEEEYAGKRSELEQVESALGRLEEEIGRIRTQLEKMRGVEEEQARQSRQALARLQEAAALAARGMMERDTNAGLFLDYLVHAGGKAYAAADAGGKESRSQIVELAEKLAGLEEERKQAERRLAELRTEAGGVARTLSEDRRRLARVRQELAAVQRMIYTNESRVWQGKRELRRKLGFADFVWPLAVEGAVSSDYGLRLHPIFNEERFHTGVDLACEAGVPIKAAADGTVVMSGELSGYGRTVIIDHGGGVSTLYGHTSRLLVQAGEQVRAGETIALVGSTGLSTGPHLHFEVRQDQEHVDPWIWLS